MDRWTPETYDELWIEDAELEEFEQVIERLIEMQRSGAPILTPPNILRLFPDSFRGKKAPEEVMPCRVGLRDFFIRTDGEVQVCVHYPSIGNIREQSARDIWYGPKAQEIRRKTVACDRLCLITCLSQKTLMDKVKMGRKLLKGQNRRASDTALAAEYVNPRLLESIRTANILSLGRDRCLRNAKKLMHFDLPDEAPCSWSGEPLFLKYVIPKNYKKKTERPFGIYWSKILSYGRLWPEPTDTELDNFYDDLEYKEYLSGKSIERTMSPRLFSRALTKIVWLNDHGVYDPLSTILSLTKRLPEVCDIGCGGGKFLQRVREHGATPTGIDPSIVSAQSLRSKNIEFHLGTAEASTAKLGQQAIRRCLDVSLA